MRIDFSKARYKNLLSTGNDFIEIDLSSHNTTLLCGDNGSGKSTFMDAICYALYGKPFRKINKPQLINTVTGKGLVVEIEFSVGQTQYKVIRGQKPTIFELYKNGTLLPQDAESKDYQQVLEKQILKMNFKTFCQIVILGSANFTPFMQLPAAQKREFGEDMLDIQYFTVMNNLLKLRIQQNNQAVDTVNREIELIDTKLMMVSKQLEDSAASKEKIIVETEQKIRDLGAENLSLQAKHDELMDKVFEIERKTSKKSALQDKRDDISYSETRLMVEIHGLLEKNQFFESHTNCPTCTQAITEEFRDGIVRENSLRAADLDGEVKKYVDERKKVELALKGLEKYDRQINQLKQEAMAYSSSIATNRKIMEHYKLEIERQKTNSVSDETFNESLQEQRDALEIKKESLVNQKDLFNNAAVLLKDTGVKAQIIRQYVPVLNTLINKYLEQMDFFCLFEMNENFEETIKARHLDEFSYESFSEGEKMRVNLSMLFAWREIAKMRNSAATNLLILDEVMDGSLDAAGMDEFLGIVKDLAKSNNIFIISHKTDQISDRFEKVIRFTKEKNFSRIM